MNLIRSWIETQDFPLGEPQQAIEHYEQALAIAQAMGDRPDAEKQTERLQAVQVGAIVRRAATFHEQGEFEKALEEYNRAIILNENNTRALVGRADVYNALHQHDLALGDYRAALKLHPDNPYNHNNIAETYLALRRLDEAIPHLTRRIELSPDDALSAHVMLAIIHHHTGQLDEATMNYRRTIDIWDHAWQTKLQTPAALLENKAYACLGLGQTADALDTLQEALRQVGPADCTEFDKYDLLAEAPNPPAGLAQFRALLEQFPPPPTSADD